MRGWTRKRFEAAATRRGVGPGEPLWLVAREAGPPSRLARLDRAGTRAGRLAVLCAAGCVASGLLPGSALGPVSKAQASLADLRLERADPVPGGDDLPPIVAVEPVGAMRPAFADVAVASPVAPVGSDTLRPDPDLGREEAEAFLRFGDRDLPRRLVGTILRAAQEAEVDPIYLMALADKESSFRPDVRASTSSAEGLFQFIERTWLESVKAFGAKHGLADEAARIAIVDERPVVADDAARGRILALRRDPYVAALMAAELLRRDAALIGFQVGRALTPTELYLAHFLGLDDATRFITLRSSAKAQSATAAFPAAARANAAIFFERVRRGRRGLSVPEVYARLDRMIDRRVALYHDVREVAPDV